VSLPLFFKYTSSVYKRVDMRDFQQDRAPLLQDEGQQRRIGGWSGGGQGLDKREELWEGEEEDWGFWGRMRRLGHLSLDELETWTEELNAKLPMGNVDVYSFT
jgi:hypothetical protein